MRHILVFNKKNEFVEHIHIKGKLLNPNEIISMLNISNYIQLEEKDLIYLCGKEFQDKIIFIEKDSKGNLFFNEEKYLESKKDNEIS